MVSAQYPQCALVYASGWRMLSISGGELSSVMADPAEEEARELDELMGDSTSGGGGRGRLEVGLER